MEQYLIFLCEQIVFSQCTWAMYRYNYPSTGSSETLNHSLEPNIGPIYKLVPSKCRRHLLCTKHVCIDRCLHTHMYTHTWNPRYLHLPGGPELRDQVGIVHDHGQGIGRRHEEPASDVANFPAACKGGCDTACICWVLATRGTNN